MELYKGLSEGRRKNTKRFLAIASNILAIIIKYIANPVHI